MHSTGYYIPFLDSNILSIQWIASCLTPQEYFAAGDALQLPLAGSRPDPKRPPPRPPLVLEAPTSHGPSALGGCSGPSLRATPCPAAPHPAALRRSVNLAPPPRSRGATAPARPKLRDGTVRQGVAQFAGVETRLSRGGARFLRHIFGRGDQGFRFEIIYNISDLWFWCHKYTGPPPRATDKNTSHSAFNVTVKGPREGARLAVVCRDSGWCSPSPRARLKPTYIRACTQDRTQTFQHIAECLVRHARASPASRNRTAPPTERGR